LTLGRVKRQVHRGEQQQVGEVIAKTDVGDLGQVRVDSFRLMRSDLRRDGAVYSPLSFVPLKQK
jgi:2'-5' RNA ligase